MTACPCPVCKAARPRSTAAGRSLARVHDRHARTAFRAVKAWFRAIDRAVRYGVEQQLLLGRKPRPDLLPGRPISMGKALPGYNATALEIADGLADWRCLGSRGDAILRPHQVRVYGEAMGRAAELGKLRTPWALQNRRAAAWARRHVTPHMGDLALETRNGIARLIGDGLEAGMSTARIGR
ncbi:MAG: hypothetical protein ABIL09_16145, partial [Gemmatimonadota bacterium]